MTIAEANFLIKGKALPPVKAAGSAFFHLNQLPALDDQLFKSEETCHVNCEGDGREINREIYSNAFNMSEIVRRHFGRQSKFDIRWFLHIEFAVDHGRQGKMQRLITLFDI